MKGNTLNVDGQTYKLDADGNPIITLGRKKRREMFRLEQPRNVRKMVFGRWRTRYAGDDAIVHF